MTSESRLYEPMIERELGAIPDAIAEFAAENDARALFDAVCRFAVLAYAPSQHSKSAVLACHAAWQLRDLPEIPWGGLMTECARYASESRVPWSEPPVGTPPEPVEGEVLDGDAIARALAAGDRLGAERWLGARLGDPDFARQYFAVAASDLSGLGQKLIVATAAWELATLVPEAARFAVLRIAAWEWAATAPEEEAGRGAIDPSSLVSLLVRRFVAERGSAIAFQDLSLYDAALRASSICGDEAIESVVRARLAARPDAAPGAPIEADLRPPVYPLIRDYAEYLQAWPLVGRLEKRFPGFDFSPVLKAARYNLDHTSFEEWSFA